MAEQFVLSYPFRFDIKNQKLATVSDESDSYKAQQINAFIKTEKNERALFPTYGITDPVFKGFDAAEFIESFTDFYKTTEICIKEVEVTNNAGFTRDAAAQNVAVQFE